MTTSNLSFAKIVANPSALGWSQVYSAGKLFAAISLEKSEEGQEKDYLNVLGKEILSTLEQEFFTLETKASRRFLGMVSFSCSIPSIL